MTFDHWNIITLSEILSPRDNRSKVEDVPWRHSSDIASTGMGRTDNLKTQCLWPLAFSTWLNNRNDKADVNIWFSHSFSSEFNNNEQPYRQKRWMMGLMCIVLYFRRGHFDVDDDGSQRRLEKLRWVVDGVCIQDDQLKGLGQLKDPLYLTLDLGCEHTKERDTFSRATSPSLSHRRRLFLAGIHLYLGRKASKTHRDWSVCWISPLWPSCSAPIASPVTNQQSPV